MCLPKFPIPANIAACATPFRPYRREVTLGEDASRIRKGVAPQLMAALRNRVVYVLNDVVAPSLAAAVRKVNNCLDLAFKLLGLPQIE